MLYLAKISSLTLFADVVELVDTYALGAYALGREGSSPFIRTTELMIKTVQLGGFLMHKHTLSEERATCIQFDYYPNTTKLVCHVPYGISNHQGY